MAVKRTEDSQTDTINRAIQVYAYLADITGTGGTLYVRDAGGDELERLHNHLTARSIDFSSWYERDVADVPGQAAGLP